MHVVEEQLGGVLRLHADLVEHAAHAVALAALGLDDEDRGALGALRRVGLGHDQHHAREKAVGDEGLGAADAVAAVGLLLGARAHALQVGAGARLGHGDGADQLAARHARQVALLLFLGAVVQEVVRHDGVHRAGHAAECAARLLFVEHGLVAEVAARAAVGLGNVGAQQAERAGLAPHLVADVAALARLFVVRHDFGLDETHDVVAVQLQFFVAPRAAEIDGHGVSFSVLE
ncbi:hypothetical protein D3C72_1619680 [compost metagenome]